MMAPIERIEIIRVKLPSRDAYRCVFKSEDEVVPNYGRAMYLIPTFKPPPTSTGRQESQHERLGLLLGGSPVAFHTPAASRAETHYIPSKRKADATNNSPFSLFDGSIVVPQQDDMQVSTSVRSFVASRPATQSVSKVNGLHGIDYGRLSTLLEETIPATTKAVTSKAPLRGRPEAASSARGIADRVVTPTQCGTDNFGIADFTGIERCCRNAGASVGGLRVLVDKIAHAQHIACAVMWSCLSTNHAQTTQKFCTHSNSCSHWNCTCDRHIRGDYLARNSVAIVFHIPGEEFVYFLPLVRCKEPSAESTSQQPNSQGQATHTLPLQCGSTLQERIAALVEILGLPEVVKVVYNTQLVLIPLLQLVGNGGGDLQQSCPFTLSAVANMSDPRVAAYLLDSDIAEPQLELHNLFEQYGTTSAGPGAPGWDNDTNHNAGASHAADVSSMGRFARAIHRVRGELERLIVLHSNLEQRLAQSGLLAMHKEIEMPVACLLAQMELTGVVVNAPFLDHMRATLSQRVHDTELQIFAAVEASTSTASTDASGTCAASAVFNVASPEQVARVLYEVLALPAPAQTSKKGKHQSTSEEDLLRVRHLHPAVGLILDYRALAKLQSTYVDGLRPFICTEPPALHAMLHPGSQREGNAVAGATTTADAFGVLMQRARASAVTERLEARLEQRVHANWQHTAVRTGRLSCVKPNLQNVPNTQTVAGLEIRMRSAFQATQG
jgi:hypothetical protein